MRGKFNKFSFISRISLTKKILIIFLLLMCIIVGIFVHIVSSPVHGKYELTNKSLYKPKTKKGLAEPSAASVDSPYYKLDLPTGYRIQTGNSSVPGLLYQQTIMKTSTFGSLIISVSVKSLPEGGLSSDSAYSVRTQQPNIYKITDVISNSETVKVASDRQSGVTVAFWPHAGYLATFGVTSGISENSSSANNELLEALKPVLEGWQWR